jgi:hypothetical protein
MKQSVRLAVVGLVAAFGLVAASCAPPAPGGGPAPVNWSFKGTNVTVNSSQDAVYDPLFGACISFAGCRDEPYLLQIRWQVTIGQPGSAQASVVGSRDNAINDLGPGQSSALTGAQQATATWNNIVPLDVLDALNPSNKLTVFGTYTWAVEQDTVGIGSAANSVANVFRDALNATLATAALPSDSNALVNMVLDLLLRNAGSAINIALANIPLFGLGDDLLGGAFYIGLGATGTLASVLDGIVATTAVPTLNLLGDNMIPPKIVGGKLYTLSGPKTFTQAFTGAGGKHTYTFQSGPA